MVLLFMVLNASIQMVSIGKLFSTYLDMNYTLSIILGTVMVTTYSVTGGFGDVIITDIIQFGFLLFYTAAVFITIYNNSGCTENIEQAEANLGRHNFFNFFAGTNDYAVYVFTFGVSWVIQANVWQRAAAAPSPKDTTKLAVMSFFIYIYLYLMVALTGMAAVGMYSDIPKKRRGGVILISVIKDYMHPALTALVFLGLSAAIMSAIDSLINTGAMAFSLNLLPK